MTDSDSPAGPIPWRDEFATGVASIDHEHQEMIALLNRGIVGLDSGDRDVALEFLGEVHSAISAHFALEESIMRREKYGRLEAHKEDHERLLDDVREIMDAFEAGHYAERRDEFTARLRDWFVDHFREMDSDLHDIVPAGD